MPKKFKGGGLWDTISNSVSNAYQSTKNSLTKKSSSITTPTTSSVMPTTSTTSSVMPTYGTTSTGGRKRGGGFKSSTSVNNIASTAAPVSGLKTASAHNLVGGKTRRRRRRKHRHSKSCKHNKK
jgi:hypothetical protein